MNAPIEVVYQTGQTIYSILISEEDGAAWNETDQVWETYNSGHWAKYAVHLTEYTGSGYYRAAYPIAAPSFLTTDLLFAQSGGSPALGDTPVTAIYHSQGENVAAAANSWTAAHNMGAALRTQQVGAISGTPPDATTLPTNLTNSSADAYAGRAIIMTSGALIQQASFITEYDGTTFTLTTSGFPSGGTPVNGDEFIII